MPTDDRPHSQRAADVLAAFEYDDLTTNEALLASRPARAQVHATLAVGEQLVRLNKIMGDVAAALGELVGDPSAFERLRRGEHVDVEPQQHPHADAIGCAVGENQCRGRVHTFDIGRGCQLGF